MVHKWKWGINSETQLVDVPVRFLVHFAVALDSSRMRIISRRGKRGKSAQCLESNPVNGETKIEHRCVGFLKWSLTFSFAWLYIKEIKWKMTKNCKAYKSQRRIMSMEITGLSVKSLLRPSVDLVQSERKKRTRRWIDRRRTMFSWFVRADDSTEERWVWGDRREKEDLLGLSIVSLCSMRRAMCSCRDLAWRTERKKEREREREKMLQMSRWGKRSYSV